MRVTIQAVQRQGFTGYWTPQRFWSSSEPSTVEVVDGADDPVGSDGKPDLTKIGQSTWVQVQGEQFLSFKTEVAPIVRELFDEEPAPVVSPAPKRGPRAVPAATE